MVAGYADDPLDEVVDTRGRAEQASDRLPEPGDRRRGLDRDGVPGTVAVEHNDVAAVYRAEVVDELVDEDLVPDLQGVLHRGRGDEERLDHEALYQQREHEREDEQDRQFDPPGHALAPLAAAATAAGGYVGRWRGGVG